MSDSLALALALLFTVVVPVSVGVYGAYWAFSIRRTLVGPVYRGHAFWLGVVSFMLYAALAIVNLSSSSLIVSVAQSIVILTTIAVVFGFVDSTVPIMRRSDPLLRGILHWSRVRIALWLDVCLAGLYFVYSAIDPSFGSSGVWAVLGFPLLLLPFIIGAPALLIGVRRSRDPILRRSIEWFTGLLLLFLANALLSFMVLIVFDVTSYAATYSYPALVFAPGMFLGSYCLYRSARSLAPINRLQLIDPETSIVPFNKRAATW
jgi:hypothetical protein